MEIVNLLNPYSNNNNHRDPIYTYQSQLITRNNSNINLNMNINNLTHHSNSNGNNSNIFRNTILSDSTSGIQILSNLSCNREFLQNNNNNIYNSNNNNNTDIETINSDNQTDNEIDSDSFLNDNNFKDLIKMELSSDCSFSSGCESEYSSSDFHHRLPTSNTSTTNKTTTTRVSKREKSEKVPKTPIDPIHGIPVGKKPRKSYEVSKKLEILDEKTKHGMSFVVEKYHISRSIISRWLSNIEKYRSFNKKNLKKLHKGPKASFSMEQEQLIIDKINDCKTRGEVVNGETIKHFALELSKQLNNFSFKASSGWLENFKNRHNLQLK